MAAMISSSLSMFIPGWGVNTLGRPEAWVRRSNTVSCWRRPPVNSGITSETLVVRASWPSSMARNTRTLVIALVTEKMLNTVSSVSALETPPASVPKAISMPVSPPRVTLIEQPK